MDEGLALVGNDVGTPIIAITNSDGVKAGYFGPVITKVPPTDKSVAMWDALVTMMDIDSFFELKRTRTEAPDPERARPDRPPALIVAERRRRPPTPRLTTTGDNRCGGISRTGVEQTPLERGLVDRPHHADVGFGPFEAAIGHRRPAASARRGRSPAIPRSTR